MASAHKDVDLFQAIRGLRPHFLQPPRGARSMGGSGMSPTAVYVDGHRQTGTDALVEIPAANVEEVRYLEPSRAENEFGISANGGAIVVKRVKDKPPQS